MNGTLRSNTRGDLDDLAAMWKQYETTLGDVVPDGMPLPGLIPIDYLHIVCGDTKGT